jgi:hypothetical protein
MCNPLKSSALNLTTYVPARLCQPMPATPPPTPPVDEWGSIGPSSSVKLESSSVKPGQAQSSSLQKKKIVCFSLGVSVPLWLFANLTGQMQTGWAGKLNQKIDAYLDMCARHKMKTKPAGSFCFPLAGLAACPPARRSLNCIVIKL